MSLLPPNPPGPPLAQSPLGELVAACRGERGARHGASGAPSPACAEIFRRALAHDADAQAAVSSTFNELLRAWVGAQQFVEADDVLQVALNRFFRAAPQRPELLAGDELARVLAYLRRCVQTAVLSLLPSRPPPLPIDAAENLPAADDAFAAVELRLQIRERVTALVRTDAERLVFHLYFVCAFKPQAIVQRHPERFTSAREVYAVIQNLRNRLRGDAALQQLWHGAPEPVAAPGAVLHMEAREPPKEATPMEPPCTLDDAALLEYANGTATPELRAAVERSPACLAAAQRLASDLAALAKDLYRITCPSVETLLDFHERRLAGAELLAIHAHIAECPLCQQESAILAAIDAVPLEPAGPLASLRRAVEALFQPAPALRGDTLHFRSPGLEVFIVLRPEAGPPPRWTLRGQALARDGAPATDLEGAALLPLDGASRSEQAGTLEADGAFVFRALAAGSYRLRLTRPDEDVIVREIVVGDE
jgi:DNA-directed RNA polymerase specialized sigma24 family protein